MRMFALFLRKTTTYCPNYKYDHLEFISTQKHMLLVLYGRPRQWQHKEGQIVVLL